MNQNPFLHREGVAPEADPTLVGVRAPETTELEANLTSRGLRIRRQEPRRQEDLIEAAPHPLRRRYVLLLQATLEGSALGLIDGASLIVAGLRVETGHGVLAWVGVCDMISISHHT